MPVELNWKSDVQMMPITLTSRVPWARDPILRWHLWALPSCLVVSAGFCMAVAVVLGPSLDVFLLAPAMTLATYATLAFLKLCTVCLAVLSGLLTLLHVGRFAQR